MSYSPHRRTAVLLTGTGAAGAYHAGALRALHEAGIKIDVVSGRGVGAAGALFAAVDASARTWDEQGIWRSEAPAGFYRWRASLRWAGGLLALAAVILVAPLLLLSTGLITYPLSFLLQMVDPEAGRVLALRYAQVVEAAFAPGALPTIVPRLVTGVLAVALVPLAIAAIQAAKGTGPWRDRRCQGRWWSRMIGAPWTARPAIRYFHRRLAEIFRGVMGSAPAGPADVSRRYVEMVLENLGQPGFREVMVTAHDLDARGDLIFAILAEPYRQQFFHRTGARRSRPGETIDLVGAGRPLLLDALSGALSPGIVTEPHRISFAPESYWKGETHRICDHQGSLGRLLEELAAAGVEQVIVVCASADRSAPHAVTLPRGDVRSQIAEAVTASEASLLRDAISAHTKRFQGIFLIQPLHNPIGPFDFRGAYDERSNRFQSLGESIDRGYEDAYRQFIDPVVAAGAS